MNLKDHWSSNLSSGAYGIASSITLRKENRVTMLKVIQRLMLILVAVLSLGASAGWQRLGRLDVGLPADHDLLSSPPESGRSGN
jgi:hypothetical protein